MTSRMESKISSPVVIGVDIGKEVFHLVGLTGDGKIAFRRRISRLGLKDAIEKLPPCIVAMEACLSAHFVSRMLRGLGHEKRIVPAIYIPQMPDSHAPAWCGACARGQPGTATQMVCLRHRRRRTSTNQPAASRRFGRLQVARPMAACFASTGAPSAAAMTCRRMCRRAHCGSSPLAAGGH